MLLGTLLVGIVTMQLSLLRLNAGIGRAVEHTTVLQQSNAALRLQISQLSNSESIVAQATLMGFVTPLQGSPRFLNASSTDAGKALTTMRVPDPAAAAAAAAAATATVPSTASSTTTTPVDTTSPGTTGTTPVTTPAPAATTVTPTPATGTTAGTTTGAGTTAPTAGTTAPAVTPAAGGASAPVGPQG